jgi:hypothetical protein
VQDVAPNGIKLDSTPQLANGVSVLHVGADVKEIINCLRVKIPTGPAALHPTVLAIRQSSGSRTEVLKLPSLSAQILGLCDGTKRVGDIAEQFSARDGDASEIDADQVCLYVLHLLDQCALIEFR